jgi:hypothetical protein
MKHFIFMMAIGLSLLFYSCSKKTEPVPETPTTPTTPTGGNGSSTPANGYVVKTIGISLADVSVDDNFKLKVADLYGGGNRIVLKAGTTNKMEMLTPSVSVLPDVFDIPWASLPYVDQIIDNGVPPTDTTGNSATVIKLKGFDKAKTGYNQLNLVVSKFLWVAGTGDAGFRSNMFYYLNFNKKSGTKNSEYGADFVKGLFTGNVSVSSIQIAEPKSKNPYITEDKIITAGIATYDLANNKPIRVDLKSDLYRGLFATTSGINVGSPLKFEWVNADKGTIKKYDDYSYDLKFDNIKVAGLDQIVEPADSINKVFLRVTGFNPALTGFNQLRLFITNNGFDDGALQVIYNAKQPVTPSISSIKDIYLAKGLFCQKLSPNFAHY